MSGGVWAEFLRGARLSRVEFWISAFFIVSGGVGLGLILAADAFSNHGAGYFWVAWTVAGVYLFVRSWRRAARVTRARSYALANEFEPLVHVRADHYPGMLFAHNAIRITEGVRTRARHFVEIGNIDRIRDPEQFRPIGYVRMSLPRRVPHIVLLQRRNGTVMPFDLKGTQRLSLEGDFDDHFLLYAPVRYETDALHIFSPDVMELFIQDADGFTGELVDDELYLYSRRPLDVGGRNTITSVENLLAPIATKLGHQLDHYTDDRATDPKRQQIAPQGRRLIGPVATVGAVIVASILLILLRIYLFRS